LVGSTGVTVLNQYALKEREANKLPVYRDSFAPQLRYSKPYLAKAKRGFERLAGKQNSQRSNR
jgi:hypothetical protein